MFVSLMEPSAFAFVVVGISSVALFSLRKNPSGEYKLVRQTSVWPALLPKLLAARYKTLHEADS